MLFHVSFKFILFVNFFLLKTIPVLWLLQRHVETDYIVLQKATV